jgi:dUTP pyrophosphatase
MSRILVKVSKVSQDVLGPIYATQGSSGADLHAYIPKQKSDLSDKLALENISEVSLEDADSMFGIITIYPGERKLIKTGLKLEIAEGFEIQIRSRSGLALKNGISVLNSPGTIDSDYRGEIGVILINHGDKPFVVQNGDRIAQAVLVKVERAVFEEDLISQSERGEGGFGHTGIESLTKPSRPVAEDFGFVESVGFRSEEDFGRFQIALDDWEKNFGD